MNDPILLSKREAARSLSISLRTLDRLIASNEISARRIGRRVLVARRSLEHFAAASAGYCVKGQRSASGPVNGSLS